MSHGYGAPGDDLVPIGALLLRRFPELAETTRFVFPEAPLSLNISGFYDARAWWQIDVGRYERAMVDGTLDEQLDERPEGLAEARRKLRSVVDTVLQEAGLGMNRLVLAGFSQGAMLTTDLSLRLEESPAALGIFSGFPVCRSEWRTLASRRKGLRVIQSHGTQDPLLPFPIASTLVELLKEAGLQVDFQPFDGPHTIPESVVDSFGAMLCSLQDPAPEVRP